MSTPYKYIQKRMVESGEVEYLVIFPEALRPKRTLGVFKEVGKAIAARDDYLQYNPDVVGQMVTEEDTDARTVTFGKTFTFGAIGDTHLGSKYERLDVLEALYDVFEAHDVDTVFHTGNWIEGEASFNKDDLNIFGVGNQFDYFFQNWPERPGISTYFVGGDDHEGWYWKKHGIPITSMWTAKQKEHERYDMVYLGYMEADFVKAVPRDEGGDDIFNIRVIHPGGGSAKSISLQAQNIVDSWHPDEYVDILLVGHYHKAHMLPDYKGVTVLQTGTCQDKTPFIKKNKIAVHIGGWIVVASKMSDGGQVTQATYFPYKARRWRMVEKVVR